MKNNKKNMIWNKEVDANSLRGHYRSHNITF